jgi:hypothetical protein
MQILHDSSHAVEDSLGFGLEAEGRDHPAPRPVTSRSDVVHLCSPQSIPNHASVLQLLVGVKKTTPLLSETSRKHGLQANLHQE